MLSPVNLLQLTRTEFIKSAPNLLLSPDDKGLEIAFVGRSNSGKSSALNALLGRDGLAKTSKTPGRTQLINYFKVDDAHRIVDLPGYGFAKVSHQIKQQIEHILEEYLLQRQSIVGLILLVDIRRELNENDEAILSIAMERGIPVRLLMTKCDKLSRSEANSLVMKMQKHLASNRFHIQTQAFSALKRIGVDEAREVLLSWFQDKVD